MGWLTRKEVGAEAFLDQGQSAVPSLFGSEGNALYPEPSFSNHVTQAWSKNELVYACIMEKATSLPEAPLRVYAGDGLGEPRESHPLRLLMQNPNPVMTEFELVEITMIHLDLAGNAFWEIVLDKTGKPKELWPLRPDRTRIVPDRGGNHSYFYVLGSGKPVPLGTDVIHFKLPNPADPYVGQAPLRPALRAVALDNEATDFVKVLLQNRAVPGTVIETEQRLDEELANRLTEKWIQRFGKNRNGRPAFMQKGMKVHPIGLDLKELEFPDLRTIAESRICMTLGVPPILVGAKVGLDRSTFANYAEARSSFWEETLMPLQKRLQSAIAKKLMPYYEGPRPRRTVVQFDNSQVRALRESEGRRWELATQALRAGAITVNTFNRMVNLPNVQGGDVFLIPAGVAPVENPSAAPASNPTAAPPPADATDEGQTAPEDDAEAGSSAEQPKGDPTPPQGKARVPEALTTRFRDDVSAFARRQQDAIVGDLERAKGTRLLAIKAWDEERWDDELTGVLTRHMTRIARLAARRVDRDADVTVMDAYIAAGAARLARDWNGTTREAVAAASRRTDWREPVNEAFDQAAGNRAAVLAASTAVGMNAFGAVDTAKRVGIGYKTWVVNSGNPRSAHAALDGETVPIAETFSNGAAWPGDSSLDVDEIANCQCSVEFANEGM